MQFIMPRKKFRQRTGLILIIILAIALISGVISAYEDGIFNWRSLLGNLSTELMGGVITFVLIDRLISRNEDDTTTRNSLIGRLENHESGLVQAAVQELRQRGWLQDGSLYGWFLKRANFEGIDLRDARMNGLGIYRCHLKDARITDQQFACLNDLRRTTMPDNSLYDGRFCLSGDISWAKTHYGIDFMTASIEDMAAYYEVSPEAFLAGQKWAKENLPLLGQEVPPYLNHLILNAQV